MFEHPPLEDRPADTTVIPKRWYITNVRSRSGYTKNLGREYTRNKLQRYLNGSIVEVISPWFGVTRRRQGLALPKRRRCRPQQHRSRCKGPKRIDLEWQSLHCRYRLAMVGLGILGSAQRVSFVSFVSLKIAVELPRVNFNSIDCWKLTWTVTKNKVVCCNAVFYVNSYLYTIIWAYIFRSVVPPTHEIWS